MSSVELGKQIKEVKERIIPHIAGRFGMKEIRGRWYTRINGKVKRIGSSIFPNSCELNIVLPRRQSILIDVFPVSVRDFMEFIKTGEYFNSHYWPTTLSMPENKADKVIRRILNPAYYDTPEEILAHTPVTNISWPEAYAYCKWINMYLPCEILWECAAIGSTKRKRFKFYGIRSKIPMARAYWRDLRVEENFSGCGCWLMLGGILEWSCNNYTADFYKWMRVQGDRHVDLDTVCNLQCLKKNGYSYRHRDLDDVCTIHKESRIVVKGQYIGNANALSPDYISYKDQVMSPYYNNIKIGFRCLMVDAN